MKRINLGHMVAALATVCVIMAAALVVDQADAAEPGRPYGGCGEAFQDWPAYENTPGTRWCAEHGWTIRHRFALDPRNRVRMLWLPPCQTEDSTGCYWNARTRGNGRGDSFIRTRKGRVFYAHFAADPVNVSAA